MGNRLRLGYWLKIPRGFRPMSVRFRPPAPYSSKRSCCSASSSSCDYSNNRASGSGRNIQHWLVIESLSQPLVIELLGRWVTKAQIQAIGPDWIFQSSSPNPLSGRRWGLPSAQKHQFILGMGNRFGFRPTLFTGVIHKIVGRVELNCLFLPLFCSASVLLPSLVFLVYTQFLFPLGLMFR